MAVIGGSTLLWHVMEPPDLVLTSERVLTPSGLTQASVTVRGGMIRGVDAGTPSSISARHVDLGELVLMPGIVDTHVHVNEPGRTEWEGFETAGRAAAAGGVTMIVDMPLNSSPVTTTTDALEAKVRSAEGKCLVDYGFWGGVVPGNADALPRLLEAGVLGFKCFLVDSGIDEFPPVDEYDLRSAMAVLSELGCVLLVHAEAPAPIEAAARELTGDPRSYATFLGSRPPEAELQAIDLVIGLSGETGCALHIVHLSTADALPRIREARRGGLRLTAETCPHYLALTADEIPDGATVFKCTPPIRDDVNREGLWRGLAQGDIDLVASDHSPCPPGLKCLDSGDFLAAWGGIASLQLGLSVTWTEAERRGSDVRDVAAWMCEGPARLAGIAERKGRIAPGYDADLVVWDPEATYQVSGADLEHRHSLTPYEGRTLRGRVHRTYVRGTCVFDGGEFAGTCPGAWIRR